MHFRGTGCESICCMRCRSVAQFVASATALMQQLHSAFVEQQLVLDLAGPELMESVDLPTLYSYGLYVSSQVGIGNWRPRVYNGQLVGPTIRVSPGDTLRIVIINKLSPPEGAWHNNHLGRVRSTPIWHIVFIDSVECHKLTPPWFTYIPIRRRRIGIMSTRREFNLSLPHPSRSRAR